MTRGTKLSESGSITLPAALRKEMKLIAGQRFTAMAKGSSIILVPVVDVRTLRGSAKGADTTGFRD
ncbi:MAG TPA: AbrB/MazE/SpoVT family DNA-binding domain-containing protein [Myxococcota bacterium]|nr:AbrB/MazE/SpoVT family DNA-binding domain-containing protein [Myxococcota bacterium]HND31097.1 AbrB/MazE/SpoVT family DNA-binding domain-containing protein [Myxococcota bacterium]